MRESGFSVESAAGQPYSGSRSKVDLDGTKVTAITLDLPDRVKVQGYHVGDMNVGDTLAIRGGLNFLQGAYRICGVDSESNTLILDRRCAIGPGSAMIGRLLKTRGRWYEPVRELYDPSLPDHVAQGEARERVLRKLSELNPEVLISLRDTCLRKDLLEPPCVREDDWPGPYDQLQWGHICNAGDAIPNTSRIVAQNLKPLREALTLWMTGSLGNKWNFCDNDGQPIEWVADSAVQTLIYWLDRGGVPKVPRFENDHFYSYRSLQSPSDFRMLDLERKFDRGEGIFLIAPEDGIDATPFSARQQRKAKKEYKVLGESVGLKPMPHRRDRYFEWYALRTFLNWKLREIREWEIARGGRKVGEVEDPDDLDAVQKGVVAVGKLVGFHRNTLR